MGGWQQSVLSVLSLLATIFLPVSQDGVFVGTFILSTTISGLSLHRKNAAQLWRKCLSCQRELFSEDHFCMTCGQCLDCCEGTHAVHQHQTSGHYRRIWIAHYARLL